MSTQVIPLSVIRRQLESAGLSLQPTLKGILLTGPGDVLEQLATPTAPLPKLTERQREVFEAIYQLTAEGKGTPPTVRKIGEVMGLTSTASVQRHIEALREKGYLLPADTGRGLCLLA